MKNTLIILAATMLASGMLFSGSLGISLVFWAIAFLITSKFVIFDHWKVKKQLQQPTSSDAQAIKQKKRFVFLTKLLAVLAVVYAIVMLLGYQGFLEYSL